jgi:hypothetical protein
MASALWSHARPLEALVAAFAADERLWRMQIDLPLALKDHLITLAVGLHARAAG